MDLAASGENYQWKPRSRLFLPERWPHVPARHRSFPRQEPLRLLQEPCRCDVDRMDGISLVSKPEANRSRRRQVPKVRRTRLSTLVDNGPIVRTRTRDR